MTSTRIKEKLAETTISNSNHDTEIECDEHTNKHNLDPEDLDKELDQRTHKTCMQRWFGPIKKGSLRSSTSTLISAAMGIGALSLPNAVAECGFILGLIFSFFGVFSTYCTLNALNWAGLRTKSVNYSDLIYKLFGKVSGDLFQLLLIIYFLGVITNCQITGAAFIQNVLNLLGLTYLTDENYKKTLQIIIFNIILYPIAAQKELYFLRYGSLLIVISIVYTTIVVIGESPEYISYYTSNGMFNKEVKWINFSMEAFSSFAVFLFAYAAHILIFPIRKELARPNYRRINKLITSTVVIELFIYTSMAILGYFSTVDNTPPIIVLRNPIANTTDYLMQIASVSLIVTPVISIPLRTNPTVLQIYLLFGVKDNTKNRLLLSCGILILSGGIAIICPNIYTSLSILAGTGGCLLNFTIPWMIYIKCKNEVHKSEDGLDIKKYCAIIITIIGTIAAFCGAGYELYSAI